MSVPNTCPRTEGGGGGTRSHLGNGDAETLSSTTGSISIMSKIVIYVAAGGTDQPGPTTPPRRGLAYVRAIDAARLSEETVSQALARHARDCGERMIAAVSKTPAAPVRRRRHAWHPQHRSLTNHDAHLIS